MAGFGLTHPDKIAGQCKKIPAIGHPICSFSLIKTVSRELQEQKHGKLFNISNIPAQYSLKIKAVTSLSNLIMKKLSEPPHLIKLIEQAKIFPPITVEVVDAAQLIM